MKLEYYQESLRESVQVYYHGILVMWYDPRSRILRSYRHPITNLIAKIYTDNTTRTSIQFTKILLTGILL